MATEEVAGASAPLAPELLLAVRDIVDAEHLLDAAPAAYVALDGDGVVVGWNTTAETLFGWRREEAMGAQAADLFIPEHYREQHLAGFARVRRTGESTLVGKRLELSAVDRSGREFPVELTIQRDESPDRAAVFHAFLQDITDRQDALRGLQNERTFLRALVESLDVAVLACDAEGRLVLANAALSGTNPLRRTSGRPGPDPVEGVFQADGVTPLAPEELPLVRAFRGERVEGQEIVVRPGGGTAVRYQVRGRRIETDGGGEVLGAVVALHDVTDAHESALTRAGYSAFAMELSDTTAEDSGLARALSALAGELGWLRVALWEPGPEEGSLVCAHVWGGRGSPVVLTSGLARQAAATDRMCWREQSGGDHPSRSVAFPIVEGHRTEAVLEFEDGGSGEPSTELVSLLLTVSAQVARHRERLRAEELTRALEEQRAAFARVLEQINDYVWSIELHPNGRVRSRYSSPNPTSVFGEGIPEGADPGAFIMERMHPDDVPQFLDYLQRGRAGERADVEVRVRGFDGVERWVWVRGVPRGEGDTMVIDGITSDVTERRQLQAERERLLRAEQQQTEQLLAQMQAVDQMKDEFLATMSHELRNPVAVIAGYADLVLEDPSVPEAAAEMVGVIRRRTHQLYELLEQLFTHARLEAGLLELRRTAVHVDELAAEVVQGHRGQAGDAGLLLVLDAASGVELAADAAKLRQVLDNVLGNAIKYTPAGGRVTVSTAAEDDDVVIRVADTGIGVAEDELERLFEGRFRATSARERGIEGTGLGLAVTRGLVEAHGGRVEAAGAPGGGTVFTIRLPRTPSDQSS